MDTPIIPLDLTNTIGLCSSFEKLSLLLGISVGIWQSSDALEL